MSKRNIFSMLDTAVLKYPNAPYLSSKGNKGWIRTSFKEAQMKSRKLASAFLELGLKKGDKVAILSEAKTDWIISEFAALYAGGVSVPLSIKLLPEEVPFRVNHSDSSFFIISENTLEKVISQWKKYENKKLKLILLDQPSEKISKQCKQYGFDEGNLFYIKDLYDLGAEKLDSNEATLKKIEENTKEDQVVTISYTSGTTGNPKGIMLTHLNYFSNSHAAVATFKIKENISTLLILPTDHSFAHTVGIYTALVKGLSLHFVDARGGSVNALKNIPKNLVEAESNFLLTVPALTSNFIQKFKEGIKAKGPFIEGIFNRGVQAAIKRNGDGFSKPGFGVQASTWFNANLAEKLIFSKLRLIFGSKIEFFVGGGALLDIKQQQFYKAIGIPVYQGYGLTEATPIISTNTPFNHKMGTSGKVLEGIICKICDESGKELPKGEKGEIVIKGDNVMKGYYKNESATQETIKNGWLHTGDLGFMDEDDFLVVVGREKALLISEDGEKYSPEEIEEAIVNSAECIDQIMIYNDHEKYTTALVTINKKNLEEIIQKEGIKSYKDINRRLKEDMLSFAKQKEFEGKFPGKWIPSNFQVLQEPFTEENKMINSTLKMVRHKITETYRGRLDLMYGTKAVDKALEENVNELKKITTIS
ncbi:AMP-binding protein [Lutimonas saemankumensis]|uniref:AMP-dependent synthetase/ligase n=1 Tax=Lutimonas saemankumensis TaxID=483016 RepID=UPI001CD6CF07|nr:AMP-binding protein [Lutimonas saemankumensis]MCA0933805.1 AMP-binding protein [Lutimonas saemankumensis]